MTAAVVARPARPDWLGLATRHRVLLATAFLLVFPLLMPFKAIAVNILIYGLFALGFNMLYGYMGLLSFGHAALFGGGAYACGIAMVHLGLPWFAGVGASVLAGAGLAAAMGGLATRTRGIYFAMVTLALSQCVYYIAYQATGLTGGENGLRGVALLRIGPLDFVDPTTRYYVVAGFVAAALFVLSRILKTDDIPFARGPEIETFLLQLREMGDKCSCRVCVNEAIALRPCAIEAQHICKVRALERAVGTERVKKAILEGLRS